MAEPENHEDRLFDQNLRLLAHYVDCPEPTQAQMARWKQETDTNGDRAYDDARSPGGPFRFIKRRRMLTLATSALAAGIALVVFLVTPHGATVEAGIILHSLRQTLLDGFEMTFERIGEDGVYVDGRLAVTLRPRVGTSRFHDGRDDPSLLEVGSLFAEARLRGEETSEAKAGLDLQATLALCDSTQWAYLKTSGLPNWTIEDEPLAWAIVGLTSNGLLIDLGDSPLLPELRDASGAELDSRSVKASSRPVTDPAQLIKDFLVGRAGADQIDHVLALIAQTARDVDLREIEPGLHVLRVGRFNLSALGTDGAVKLADMTLEVRYRQGRGIESAVLEHLGAYDGLLRLTPLNDGLDPVLFDKRAAVRSRLTTVWDVSAIKPLLQLVYDRMN